MAGEPAVVDGGDGDREEAHQVYDAVAEEKHQLEIRQIFDLMDLDGGGTLSIQEIRKSLRKNKKVKKFVSSSSLLAPLLIPRLFHSTLKLLDEDGDGEVTFEEFSNFCKILAERQVVDDQARRVFQLLGEPKDLKLDDMPIVFYEAPVVLKYLLKHERLSMEENALGLPGERNHPIRVLLDPLSVHRGICYYMKQLDSDGGDQTAPLQELEFLCAINSLVDLKRKEVDQIKPVDPVHASGIAEGFAEMAYKALQRNDLAHAIVYRQQCVNIRPHNKIYRLALAEVYWLAKEYDKAMHEAILALEAAPRFWHAAWDVLRKANNDKRAAAIVEKQRVEREATEKEEREIAEAKQKEDREIAEAKQKEDREIARLEARYQKLEEAEGKNEQESKVSAPKPYDDDEEEEGDGW